MSSPEARLDSTHTKGSQENGTDEPLRVVRRLEKIGWSLAVPGALVAYWRWDSWAAVVLTLSWAVAIVWLRSLAAQVRSLHPSSPFSQRRFVVLRLLALGLGLIVLLRLGSSRPLAMTLGICVVPTALLIETARQLLRASKNPDH